MQISSRFTIAIHMLSVVATFQEQMVVSSTVLASSVNVNPVEIRRIMLQLSDAGMLDVKRGRGGIRLAKEPSEITFLDVFNAVEALEDRKLFHVHENPNVQCPVGARIHETLNPKLDDIQQSMEKTMLKYTLADVLNIAK